MQHGLTMTELLTLGDLDGDSIAIRPVTNGRRLNPTDYTIGDPIPEPSGLALAPKG
jgi:hypothetical protein